MECLKEESASNKCYHTGKINSETSKVNGHIEYCVCADCGKIVNKYNINNREVFI